MLSQPVMQALSVSGSLSASQVFCWDAGTNWELDISMVVDLVWMHTVIRREKKEMRDDEPLLRCRGLSKQMGAISEPCGGPTGRVAPAAPIASSNLGNPAGA